MRRAVDCFELRSQALKLRYWPEKSGESDSGAFLDLNWSWIKALKGLDVGELRVDDSIGGHDNLRIIFYRGPETKLEPRSEKPVIWILAVLQKKRQDFTSANVKTFRGRRTLCVERHYSDEGLVP